MQTPIANGDRFGRWVILGYAGKAKSRASRYLCRCDCGTERIVTVTLLNNGSSRSCSCLGLEKAHAACLRHGHAGTGTKTCEYNAWSAMLQRCQNPRNPRFGDYGGRGIVVCARWDQFENFLLDMGACPPGLTLDRRDNDGNYEPENCRWATRSQQQLNQRPRAGSASGTRGVRPHRKRWVAQIGERRLGSFSDIEQARRARQEAETELLADLSCRSTAQTCAAVDKCQ